MLARLAAGWRLLLVAAAGVVVAATLLAAAPLYSAAMANLGLQFRLGGQLGDDALNTATVESLLIQAPRDRELRRAIDQTFDARVGWLADETLVAESSNRLSFTFDRPDVAEPSLIAPPVELAEIAPSLRGPHWGAFLYTLSALEDLVTVTEGRLPDPAAAMPEVVLLDGFQRHALLDASFTLEAGGFDDCNRFEQAEDLEERADEVQCEPTTRLSQTIHATIVGFVSPKDPVDPRWAIYSGSLDVPERPLYASLAGLTGGQMQQAFRGVGSMPLFTSEAQLFGPFAVASPLTAMRHTVGLVANLDVIGVGEVERGISDFAALRDDIDVRLDQQVALRWPLPRALAGFRNSLTFNAVPLLLIVLQVVGIVVYYVVIVTSLLVERQAEQISVFRSRGASTGQLVGLYFMEALVIAVPAGLAAPWLASAAVAALGRTATFAEMTGGAALPVDLTPAVYAMAAAGALLALLAMLLPAFAAARRGIVDVKAQQARPPGRSLMQRYYLDAGAVAFAGFLLWKLDQRGSVFDPSAVGGWSSDPLLLLSPLVFTVAVAAAVLRLYPPLLRWTVALLLTAGGTAVALGLRRAARSPAAYARLLLLLLMAVSVGTFAASYGPTVDESLGDRVRYSAGSDIRSGMSATQLRTADAQLPEVLAIDGVEGAALATRSTIRTQFGSAVPVLGIDAQQAQSMLWYRDDFAAEPLDALMRRLQSVVPPGGGVELPPDATGVSIAVYGQSGRDRSLLWARYRDTDGIYHNERFGSPGFEGWRTLEAAVPEGAPGPLSFVGILVSDDRGAIQRSAGELVIDDVLAVRADRSRVLLDDFEGRFGWTMFGLRNTTSETLALTNDRSRSGDTALQWSWELGISPGERLLAMNDPAIPLAAVVSTSLAQSLGIEPGVVVHFLIEDYKVPFVIRAVADLFPTLDPDTGFLIVNREHLTEVVGLLGLREGRRSNELWVKLADVPLEQQRAVVETLTGPDTPIALTGRLQFAPGELAEVRADPTLRASGSGILIAAFIAVIAVAMLGFVVTLSLGAEGRSVEFAVLHAVGSSPLQILRAMVLEWGVVLVIGVAIGIVLGRRVAVVMLSFLDVTETRARVLPPFSLETDWRLLAFGVGSLAAVVAAGLLLSWTASIRGASAAQLRLTR